MKRSATGGDALSISAEIYIRATNGVETEVTPVGGTSAQALDGNYLEYIFSLNVTNDTVMNASDSIMLKFKSSAIGGAPVDLYIGEGYLNIPVPSGQFTLQSDFAAHTNDTANTNINHLTWDQKLALTNAIGSSVQLGMGAYAYSGVAIGYGAYANSFGVAIGQNATSAWAGVAYGILATASSSNAVAIGPYSWATNDSVSIGYQVTNIIADTTRLKGDLDMNWRDVTNGRALYMTNGIFTESVTVGGTNVIDAVANLNSATNTLNTALGDVQLIKYPLTNNTATTAGKAYQLSNSTWVAANCTTQQTCSKLIGLAAGDSSVTNGIQVFGPITVTNEDLVPGDPVFVSATAGEWTQTAPTNSTYVLRCLGHAFDTNKIFIKPDGIWVTIE
jgi:hypothetical protein